jgi:hypothetical protein
MIKKKIGIQRFAGMLANQLIHLGNMIERENDSRILPEEGIGFNLRVPSMMNTYLSSPTLTSSFQQTGGKNAIRSGADANGILHPLVKYNVTRDPSGQKRTKMCKCKLCLENGKQHDVGQYCNTCGESFSLCNKCNNRDCFAEHIKKK